MLDLAIGIVGYILFGIFIWVGSMNAAVFWMGFVQKRHAPSWTPLVAGICGAASIWMMPYPALKSLWWLPFLLDLGSLPGCGHSIVFHSWHRWASRAKR
jgi:hypothetical protein